MKLQELHEMTRRVGFDMEAMPFPNFPEDATFEAKFDNEYDVYSFNHQNTKIFGFKFENTEFASFIQISKDDKFYVIDNLKVKANFRGNLLFLKMIKFLNEEKGFSVYLNKFHSLGTEHTLRKIDRIFNVFLYNLKTNEKIDFSYEEYLNKTVSKGLPNDWVVLFEKLSNGIQEHILGCAGKEHENRSQWTYFNWFSNITSDLFES